jgi:hypothetical protein
MERQQDRQELTSHSDQAHDSEHVHQAQQVQDPPAAGCDGRRRPRGPQITLVRVLLRAVYRQQCRWRKEVRMVQGVFNQARLITMRDQRHDMTRVEHIP